MAKDNMGDVEGTTPIDVQIGTALPVAKASFDPGYDLGSVLSKGYVKPADLITGYCDYGKVIGKS